jgi:hypothetical protein
MLTRLRTIVRGWFAPAVRPKPTRRPCAGCGRVVAHTLGGRAYVHRCRVELLPVAPVPPNDEAA